MWVPASASRDTIVVLGFEPTFPQNLERRAVIETAPGPWQGPTLPLRQHRSEICATPLARLAA